MSLPENHRPETDKTCESPEKSGCTASSNGNKEADRGNDGESGVAARDNQKPHQHSDGSEEQSRTSPKHTTECGSSTVDSGREVSKGAREKIAVSDHALRYHFLVNSLGITALCTLGFVISARYAGLVFTLVYIGGWAAKGLSAFAKVHLPHFWPKQDVFQVIPMLGDLCSPRLGLMFVALSFRLVFVAEGSSIENANQWLLAQIFLAFIAAFLCSVSDIVRVAACHRRSEEAVR